MDAPAYYDAHPQINIYYSALEESSFEACASSSFPCTAASGGYEDLPSSPHWTDDIDGYAPASPDADKELYSAL